MKLKMRVENCKRALLKKVERVREQQAAVLNRAVKSVGIQMARRLTPVPQAQIRAELKSNQQRLAALTSLRLASKGIGILKRPLFARAMRRFVSFRAKSSGYMRAPWRLIAELMGGGHAKRFLGAAATVVMATARKLKCVLTIHLKFQTPQKSRTARERVLKELQPVLRETMAGMDARAALKGWRD